jgi:hypothetical protein
MITRNVFLSAWIREKIDIGEKIFFARPKKNKNKLTNKRKLL